MNWNNRRVLLGGFFGLMIGSVLGVEKRDAHAAPPPSSGPSSADLTFESDVTTSVIALASSSKPPQADQHQVAWIQDALARMTAVKPGQMRATLEQVFEPAGGLSFVPTYSYRGCGLFKVTVEFKSFHAPYRNEHGDWITPEDPRDVITKISKPFIETVYYD